jgi:DNA anti-recombination protein RmuC
MPALTTINQILPMKTIEQKIDRILEAVVDLQSDMPGVKGALEHVSETVDQHTTTLDGMGKSISNLSTEKVALNFRLERYDKFMKVVAEKLDLNLDAFD